MGLGSILEFRDHFATYVDELTPVIGRAGREKPLRAGNGGPAQR
jgi:hypothetical protein